jgi:Ser-tRNA(Ala) deacylase AlaX
VELRIDVQRRQLHSRFHTAGHLIAALVEQLLPGAKACAGHHWPGEARVEFFFEGILPENLQQSIETAITDTINVDLAVRRIQSHEGDRYVQIGNFPALRCGGTHCGHLKELGSVTLRAIKMKKDRLRVGYDVEPAMGNQRGA